MNMDGNNAVSDQALAADKAAAKELAKKHYEIEVGLTQIFRTTGKAEVEIVRAEPIKLLEVNENTPPSGVMPLHFGPAPASGIFVIRPSSLKVTPAEFKKIQTHELQLAGRLGTIGKNCLSRPAGRRRRNGLQAPSGLWATGVRPTPILRHSRRSRSWKARRVTRRRVASLVE